MSEATEQEAAPAEPSAGAPALELEGLTKKFGSFVAVEDVNLAVRRGDVYGFLGPNGSGKSTTIRMILGLVRPTSGEVRVFGKPATNPEGRRDVAGFVEAPGLYEYLSARNNLRILAAADRREGDGRRERDTRIKRVLETVDLTERAGDRVRAYSQGMKQRLAIAAALLREPEFLILDEPTNGLDPAGMRDIRALVRRLSGEGLTIFLSSHLLSEVEQLCNRIAVVGKGRILAEGDLAEISGQTRTNAEYLLATGDPDRAQKVLKSLPKAALLDSQPAELDGFGPESVVRLGVESGSVGAVVRGLTNADVEVLALVPIRPRLEELFLELTEGG